MKTNKYTGMVLFITMVIGTISVSAQTRNRDQANARPTVANSRPTRQAANPVINNRNVSTIERSNVQFKKEKTRVTVTRQKPMYSERVIYNNRSYDYYDGRFYIENNGRYMQASPLRGIRVRTLPPVYTNVWFGNNLYYFYEGTFFFPRNGYYEVVNPEIGTVVPALPADYEKVVINGGIFYEYNGVLYDKINNRYGRGYQVVGFID